jgi:hypothetical protein
MGLLLGNRPSRNSKLGRRDRPTPDNLCVLLGIDKPDGIPLFSQISQLLRAILLSEGAASCPKQEKGSGKCGSHDCSSDSSVPASTFPSAPDLANSKRAACGRFEMDQREPLVEVSGSVAIAAAA